jgi:hypothetical protein
VISKGWANLALFWVGKGLLGLEMGVLGLLGWVGGFFEYVYLIIISSFKNMIINMNETF